MPLDSELLDAIWVLLERSRDSVAHYDPHSECLLRQNPAFSRFQEVVPPNSPAWQEFTRFLRDQTPEDLSASTKWHTWAVDSHPNVEIAWVIAEPNPPTFLILATEPTGLNSTDVVTGIADRRALQAELERRHRADSPFAVLFVDLDEFKQINDQLGHLLGDQALREVAQRLQDCLRDSDLVGRFGGDEFVILIHGARDKDDVMPVVDRILEEIAQPLESAPGAFGLSASIGWALSAAGYASPDDMLAAADSRMYANKKAVD